MAKLVSVIRSDEYLFERRQLPLQCDDTLSLVMQLDDTCMGCSKESLKRKELERFVHKFSALTSDELAIALMVTSKDIVSLLQQMVPCVGCRRSVERLLKQLQNSGHPALEPLIVTSNGSVSIKREYLFDPKAVFALFYIHGCKMVDVMESIPKSKKNRRCNLHSLDTHTHKTRTLGMWEEAWNILSPECREEIVVIEFDALMKTLENYLRKHRFCSECKSKVLRAYDILILEVEAKNEKGYVASLYDGLRCCPHERHVHVSSNNDYIALLITRAEPELTGSRRERHAKTLDIAQEEVLTCLGIHLYERLYKLHQKLKAEEQTWQILLYLGMEALRKSFDVALEMKQGRSNLELVCEELLQEEQAKEQKREMKRQKKKKKKNKAGTPEKSSNSSSSSKTNVLTAAPEKDCHCDENTNVKNAPCHSCDENHAPSSTRFHCAFQQPSTAPSKNSSNRRDCSSSSKQAGSGGGRGGGDGGGGGGSAPCSPCKSMSPSSGHHSNHYDVGYSSGQEGSENCSQPGSRDGSDVACHEGLCNHDGDGLLCDRPDPGCSPCIATDTLTCDVNSCGRGTAVTNQQQRGRRQGHRGLGAKAVVKLCDDGSCHTPDCQGRCGDSVGGSANGPGAHDTGLTFTLQDMLEEACLSDDECEDGISEEEIQQWQANEQRVRHQRDQLRAVLRQRFQAMQTRIQCECKLHDHSKCTQ